MILVVITWMSKQMYNFLYVGLGSNIAAPILPNSFPLSKRDLVAETRLILLVATSLNVANTAHATHTQC